MYPRIEINLSKLRQNTKIITQICKNNGIDVTGVIKVCNGNYDCARVMLDNGCSSLASSRLGQLTLLKKRGIDKPLMLIRSPMHSEINELVSSVDISLNSDLDVIKHINKKTKGTHKIILMIELGDLREGVWKEQEIIKMAKYIEQDLEKIDLYGVGTNLGCYGSIEPTSEKLQELVNVVELIEKSIGRRLELISGGASTSIPRLFGDNMPQRINHLRIGEAILVGKDLEDLYGCKIKGINRDIFSLKAEIAECRIKPSYPIGNITYDAFGNKCTYEDKGDRMRALLDVGKLDYGYIEQLQPQDHNVSIVGGASDYTIVDVNDSKITYKSGDILTFDLGYSAVAFATSSIDVNQVVIEK